MTERRTLVLEAQAPRFPTDAALSAAIRSPVTPVQFRAVRLLTLGFYLHGLGRLDADPTRPWEAGVLSLEAAAAVVGLRNDELRTAERLLSEWGVLGYAAGRGYVLAESLYAAAPVAAILPWSHIASTLHGRSAALMIVRALALRLPAPDADVEASMADLATWTGYSRNQVKNGVRDAEQAGILIRSGAPGTAPRFRITTGTEATRPDLAAAPAELPAPAGAGEATQTTAPIAPPDSDRVIAQFGPCRLIVPPDAAFDVEMEVQPDGRVYYRGPGFRIGPIKP